ncbi:MAG: hypothetical protein HKN75_10655 [Bacteroidia bacterium]|nr:hypothetical protein [Bacteroidia bacterium]
MKNINIYGIALITFLIGSTFLHSSCEETTPAKAIITVVDSLNFPVVGAIVELSQDSVINQSTGVQANVYDLQITDAAGITTHEFKWEAVLNIDVTKGNLKTKDFIRLEQSNTVRKTVVLR